MDSTKPAIVLLAQRMVANAELEDAHTIASQLAKDGTVADLAVLSQALDDLAASGSPPDRCALAKDISLQYFALSPGKDRALAVFELLTRELAARGLASRLGYAQPPDALLALLERQGNAVQTELLACWMHEIVLAGHALSGEPAARAFQARLVSAGHPLAMLPLALLPIEREAPTYMPMYGTEAIEKAVEVLERGPTSTHTIPPPGEYAAPAATLVTDEAESARIREAVKPWLEGSNGKAEVRVFDLAPPHAAGLGRYLLRSLPLESTGEGLHVTRVAADVVWGALFAAAANGGAYSPGMGGAYGRCAAWTSLGALLGLPANTPIENVSVVGANAAFAMFGGTKVFSDVAWDLGVAVLRPGNGRLAVLAASDTD